MGSIISLHRTYYTIKKDSHGVYLKVKGHIFRPTNLKDGSRWAEGEQVRATKDSVRDIGITKMRYGLGELAVQQGIGCLSINGPVDPDTTIFEQWIDHGSQTSTTDSAFQSGEAYQYDPNYDPLEAGNLMARMKHIKQLW